MPRHPERPQDIFDDFIRALRGVFESDLISVALYGSAAGGDYRPGRSDLNFLVVLTDGAIERLDRAFDTVEKWLRRRVAVPLFLTEAYIRGSLDVFPIEYLDMKKRHVHVYGRDVLGGLSFEPEHVRLQCEREIKGKLLLLREGFLETGGKARELEMLIKDSLPAFVALFEALLFLKGRETPATKQEVLREGAEAFGVDASVFDRLLAVREGRSRPGAGELVDLVKSYLGTVRELALIVDSWEGE
jgi:predicted nucleotidyltransferase